MYVDICIQFDDKYALLYGLQRTLKFVFYGICTTRFGYRQCYLKLQDFTFIDQL
jgi:hypothetical protein